MTIKRAPDIPKGVSGAVVSVNAKQAAHLHSLLLCYSILNLLTASE